jgi:hypothetical protein
LGPTFYRASTSGANTQGLETVKTTPQDAVENTSVIDAI